MKITPLKSGKSEFLRVYKQTMQEALVIQKGDPDRLHYLRCSQIPYCPSSVILNYGKRGMIQAMGMRMAYYVGVGHAVHHVMQTYLAQSGTLLADYHCKQCGKKYPLSHTTECCDFPTEYDEVSISYRGIKGHIDAIFRDSQGRYWIVDFKTSSLGKYESKEKDPGPNYKSQVRAYAVLLEKQYGITVYGMMLVFIPRDNPEIPSVWEEEFNSQRRAAGIKFLKEQLQYHKKTMVAKTIEDFKPLFKIKCGNVYCEACKLSFTDLVNRGKQVLKSGRFPIKKGDE